MGDEIHGANVVRVFRNPHGWCALIGPDCESGILTTGLSPADALLRLAFSAAVEGWPFDATWRPRELPPLVYPDQSHADP